MGDEVDGVVSLVLDVFGTASEEADDLDWTSNPLADAGVKDYKADELMCALRCREDQRQGGMSRREVQSKRSHGGVGRRRRAAILQ